MEKEIEKCTTRLANNMQGGIEGFLADRERVLNETALMVMKTYARQVAAMRVIKQDCCESDVPVSMYRGDMLSKMCLFNENNCVHEDTLKINEVEVARRVKEKGLNCYYRDEYFFCG